MTENPYRLARDIEELVSRAPMRSPMKLGIEKVRHDPAARRHILRTDRGDGRGSLRATYWIN